MWVANPVVVLREQAIRSPHFGFGGYISRILPTKGKRKNPTNVGLLHFG